MVQGQNVAASGIHFIESSDSLTGSSVSTALAAGLSSLILIFYKLAHLQRKRPGTESGQGMPLSREDFDSPGEFPYAEGQLNPG